MVIKTYKCNLCREEVNKSNLLEMYWKCDIIPQRYILSPIGSEDRCDKHICKECMQMIKDYKPIGH